MADLPEQPLVLTLLLVHLPLQSVVLRPHTGELPLKVLQAGGLPGEGLAQFLILLLFICVHKKAPMRGDTIYFFHPYYANTALRLERSENTKENEISSGIYDCDIPIISCILGR